MPDATPAKVSRGTCAPLRCSPVRLHGYPHTVRSLPRAPYICIRERCRMQVPLTPKLRRSDGIKCYKLIPRVHVVATASHESSGHATLCSPPLFPSQLLHARRRARVQLLQHPQLHSRRARLVPAPLLQVKVRLSAAAATPPPPPPPFRPVGPPAVFHNV
jgi:hypothetical protein